MVNLLGMLLTSILLLTSRGQLNDFPLLKGPYIGQKPPGIIPEIFAPGIISTGEREFNSVFSPDGKEFYFTKRSGGLFKMFCLTEEKEGWTKPALVPFSANCHDFDMGFSSDGLRLFFCSTRSVPGSSTLNSGYDIWYVQRKENSWGKIVYIDGPVNSGDNQYYPTLSSDETLYFSTQHHNTLGKRDVYKSVLKNSNYSKIENLGPNVNTKYDEGDAFVAPDESYIIVCGMGRPDCLGSGDLYISFRKEDSTWTKYKHMGKNINSPFSDYCPYVSPDGKYFFFTSRRTGADDIYWVDAKVIEELSPEKL